MAARCPSLSLTITATTLHLAVGSAKSQWLERDWIANQVINSSVHSEFSSAWIQAHSPVTACQHALQKQKTKTLDNFSRTIAGPAQVGGKYDDHLTRI